MHKAGVHSLGMKLGPQSDNYCAHAAAYCSQLNNKARVVVTDFKLHHIYLQYNWGETERAHTYRTAVQNPPNIYIYNIIIIYKATSAACSSVLEQVDTV